MIVAFVSVALFVTSLFVVKEEIEAVEPKIFVTVAFDSVAFTPTRFVVFVVELFVVDA